MKDDDEDSEADAGGEEDEDLEETGPSVDDDGPVDGSGSDDALVFEIEQTGKQSGSSTGWMYWGLGSFLAVVLGVVFFCRRGDSRGLGYEPVPN